MKPEAELSNHIIAAEIMEVQHIELLLSDGSVILAEMCIWEADPDNPHQVKLSLRFSGNEITKRDENFFFAMRSIRLELEREGMLLRCYGASRNVYPSAMSLDMGAGWKAYKLKLGQYGKLKDLVSIFDTGSDVEPVTVAEQENFYRQWCEFRGG